MKPHLYIYDARVSPDEQFLLETSTALHAGDCVECDRGNYRVKYVVPALVPAVLPIVMLAREH
jgi:hypothetical protein